jgi:hypothetical protein
MYNILSFIKSFPPLSDFIFVIFVIFYIFLIFLLFFK